MGNISSLNGGYAMNLSGVKPAESRDPIPAGKYIGAIVESDIVGNKSNTGNILKLVWEVLDGQHKGRKVWSNLNIMHQNQTAQEIAQRELKSICDAVGFTSDLDDSAQLHNRPCVIAVKVTPAKDGYDAKNEISGYSPVSQQPPAFRAPAQAPAQPAAAPWGATPAQQAPIYQQAQAPVQAAPWAGAQPAHAPAQQAAPWQR